MLYTLSSDYKNCTRDPAVPNCKLQTNFSCQKCKSGFILNKNNYIYELFSQGSSSQIYQYLTASHNEKDSNAIPGPCQKIVNTNCSSVANAFECKSCLNQFYLTSNKQCMPFPLLKILNCAKYSSNTTCAECDNGYYLKDLNTVCQKHSQMDINCIKFSQSIDQQCLACLPNYYLTGNVCTLRVLSLNI